VVVPVPVALAVTVTVCAVEKLDGVKVSVVGDAVSPVFPDAATVTVSFDVGACDKASVKVPVLPWATLRLVGLALIVGVGTAISVADTIADVYPLPDAVNVVVPVLELLAVMVTVCGVEKLDGVNVSVDGDSVSPVFPLAAIETVSFDDGAVDSARVNVPVLPWATFRLVGVALIVPGGVVEPAGVQETLVGATLVPE